MAVGVVNLTLRGRYLLAITIVCFLLSQSLLGLGITSWSVYVCTSVSPTLYSEKSEVTFVFTVTGMYGTHVLFHNLTGIKICQRCYLQAHKKSTRNLLFVWTLAGCNTIINMLILAILAIKISKHITRSLRHSMEKGMHNYLKDPYWKNAIDKLQVMMKCCGVAGYEDWYEFTWIDEYHIDINSEVVKDFQTSKERIHLPITPWSCCRIDYPMQCFHDPLQQSESAYLWKEQPTVVLESIQDKGCLILLKRPIEVALIGFIVLTSLIFLLQIITVLLSRILYTSCRNAILLDCVDGIAPGWIFGRGDCGWSRGPGLYELVEATQTSYCTINSSQEETKDQRSGKSSVKIKCPPSKSNSKDTNKTTMSKSDEEPVSTGEEDALMLR